MRVGIDARPLIAETPSGIGVYLLECLRNFKVDDGNIYFLYSNAPLQNKDKILDRFRKVVVPGKIGTLMICYGLKKQLKKDKIDIFWGTEHMLPLNTPDIKKLLTVHDLALLVNSHWGGWKNVFMQNIFCRSSCKKADQIMSDSQATQYDLQKLLSINKDKINVVKPGGGTAKGAFLENKYELKNIKERIGLTDNPFFLYIGTLEPRKNIVGIVEAFNIFNEKNDGRYDLVLAGKLGWKTEPILDAVNKSPFKKNILIPGYISEAEKSFLLSNAVAFMFPSHYEGFGLPVLEAMSYGLPVITAKNSSLTEVGGEIAFYADKAEDYSQISEQMDRCAELDAESRKAISKQSKEWYSMFNWNGTAAQIQTLLMSM